MMTATAMSYGSDGDINNVPSQQHWQYISSSHVVTAASAV